MPTIEVPYQPSQALEISLLDQAPRDLSHDWKYLQVAPKDMFSNVHCFIVHCES